MPWVPADESHDGMTSPAAFTASFADFRLVKGRKVAQIVVEVPIEAADHALEVLGGVPRPDAERHVAVARIQIPPGATRNAANGSAAADHPPPPERSAAPGGTKREKTLPEKVGMRCNDVVFLEWLYSHGQIKRALDATEAAHFVRTTCGVRSRADIQPGTSAADKWLALETRFLEETGQMAERR